jgi:hypothetical protein
LIDSSTQAYLKTACMIKLNKNFADSANHCKSLGMKLFVINSYATRDALNSYLKSVFPVNNSTPRIDLNINGRRDLTDSWSLFDDIDMNLFGGLSWITKPDVLDGRKNCLIASNNSNSFGVDGTACSELNWMVKNLIFFIIELNYLILFQLDLRIFKFFSFVATSANNNNHKTSIISSFDQKSLSNIRFQTFVLQLVDLSQNRLHNVFKQKLRSIFHELSRTWNEYVHN